MTVYPSHLVPRVSLLDAQQLDGDILTILKNSLLEAVKYKGVGLYTRLEPELDALIKLALYRWTVVKRKATIGQTLLQMKYSRTVSRNQLAKYSFYMVFLSWLQKRMSDIIRFFSSEVQINFMKLVNCIDVLHSCCYLINLLIFLHQGYYGTLAERLFGLSLVPTAPPNSRQISYSYFNRELLWHGFAELLTVLLPLIPTKKFHNFIRSCLPRSHISSSPEKGEVELSQASICAVCGRSPVLPHQFGCRHALCYYCLYSKHAEQLNFSCPLCAHVLESSSQISPVTVTLL